MSIVDWRKYKEEDHGRTFKVDCTKCHKKTQWHLVHQSHWITFFSIPVFSYKTSYLWVCPNCQNQSVLTKEQFENLLRTKQTFDIATAIFS